MTRKFYLILASLLVASLISVFINNLLYLGAFTWILIGALFGYILMETDHIVHFLILKPNELTSQRFLAYLRTKDIRGAFKLIQITVEERGGLLLFRQEFFQYIFYLLSYLLITSSGNLFAKGLVLGTVINFIFFDYKYLKKLFLPSLLALFIFILLI